MSDVLSHCPYTQCDRLSGCCTGEAEMGMEGNPPLPVVWPSIISRVVWNANIVSPCWVICRVPLEFLEPVVKDHSRDHTTHICLSSPQDWETGISPCAFCWGGERAPPGLKQGSQPTSLYHICEEMRHILTGNREVAECSLNLVPASFLPKSSCLPVFPASSCSLGTDESGQEFWVQGQQNFPWRKSSKSAKKKSSNLFFKYCRSFLWTLWMMRCFPQRKLL